MSRNKFSLDKKRCIHCRACELHCKLRNQNPVGINYAKFHSEPPKLRDGKIVIKGFFSTCYHCKNAECIKVCPEGAMQRREDGIVYVVSELCSGCAACITACPWHIPVLNPETGKVGKCDLCMDRLDAGLEPACVTACTTHALRLKRK